MEIEKKHTRMPPHYTKKNQSLDIEKQKMWTFYYLSTNEKPTQKTSILVKEPNHLKPH